NRAPVAVADMLIVPMNMNKSGNVLTNDSDPDGTLAAEQVMVCKVNGLATNVGVPVTVTGGTLTLNANGSFTFMAASNFAGSVSYSYTICDHCGLSSTSTVTFTISSGARTQGYWKTHQAAFNAVLAAHPDVPNYTMGGQLLIAGVAYTST